MDIPLNIKNTSLTDADVIDSIICSYFHDDIGIIDTVNSDGTINVTHAIIPTLKNGTELEEMQIKNVEVFFPSSQYFKLKWKLAAGDKVLLVGLKDFIQNVQNVQHSSPAAIFVHYDRETIKAIPICGNSDGSTILNILDNEISLTSNIKNLNIDLKNVLNISTDAEIDIVSNLTQLIEIKNSVSSLKAELQKIYTDLLNLMTYLTTFSTGLSPTTVSANGAALNTSLSTATPLVTTDKNNVGNIFK